MMKRTVIILALAIATGYSGVVSAQEYRETYNAAIAAAEAKNFSDAYAKYELAAQQAEAAGDADIAKKSHIVCAKIAKIIGTEAYKAGNFTEALAQFEAGLKHESGYVPNLYMKGLTQKQLGDLDAAMTTLAEAANSNDAKTARAAADAIRDNYHAEASQLAAKEPMLTADAAQIRSLIAKMEEFGQAPDANSYFYLGLAAKAEGKYNEAITFADQAIALHRGGRGDKAKLWFLKGECLVAAGNNAQAKQAFSEAAFGSYRASAQHYIDTL
jgi:hypothetical protein